MNDFDMNDAVTELKRLIAELDRDIADQDKIIRVAKSHRDNLKKESAEYMKSLTAIQTKILMSKPIDEQAKFFIELENEGDHDMYVVRNKFWSGFELIPCGYNKESGQISFAVSLDPDHSNLEKTKQDIMYFLPMMRVDKAGDIIFSIDYSYTGVGYYILVFSAITEMWQIVRVKDHAKNLPGAQFMSLSGALEEIVMFYPNHHEEDCE